MAGTPCIRRTASGRTARAAYCDTTTAVQLYENHDPAHPMTRAQDEEHRTALLGHLRDQGMVVGSEVGCDFAMPVMDWSPTFRQHTPGQSVPLWALVFHDAHVGFSPALPTDPDQAEARPDDMEQFRAGQCALVVNGLHLAHVRISAANWGRVLPMVAACARFDRWMARTGGDEMVGHEFLDAERCVERVAFASGAAAIVNFADEARRIEGRTVPARDFVLL